MRTEPTTARFDARRTSQILFPGSEAESIRVRALYSLQTLALRREIAPRPRRAVGGASGGRHNFQPYCYYIGPLTNRSLRVPGMRSSSTARRSTTPRPRSFKTQTPAAANGLPSVWAQTSGPAPRDAAISARRAALRVDLALPSPAAAPTHCFPVHHTSKRSANCSKSSHPLVDSKALHAPGLLAQTVAALSRSIGSRRKGLRPRSSSSSKNEQAKRAANARDKQPSALSTQRIRVADRNSYGENRDNLHRRP